MSCGSPDLSKKDSSKLKVPDWESVPEFYAVKVEGAQLVSTEKNLGDFFGSLLIWREDGNSEELSKVLGLSSKSRELKSLHYEKLYRISNLEKKIQASQKNLDAIKIQKRKDAMERDRAETELLKSNSEEWIRGELLEGSEKAFDRYCDMSLLKFGLLGFLRTNEFSSRPSPLSICAQYYESKSFFDTESCAPDKSSGDYFRCIWEGGILKKFSLSKDGVELGLSEQSQLFDGKLKEIISEDFNPIETAFDFKCVGADFDYELSYIEDPSLDLSKIFNEVSALFKNSELIKDSLSELTKERNSHGKFYTFNDVLFNFPLLGEGVFAIGSDELLLRKMKSKEPRLFGHVKEVPEATVEEKELQKSIALMKSDLLEWRESSAELQRRYIMDFDLVSAAKMRDERLVSALFTDLMLSVSPYENSMQVKLRLNKGEELSSSFDWVTGKELLDLERSSENSMNASIDPESGRLDIYIVLKNPELFGFKQLSKKDSNIDFQERPSKFFEDKTVHLKLYPKIYSKHLHLFSGDFFLKSKEGTHLQGSVSLSSRITAK